jgi:hypothetical protein
MMIEMPPFEEAFRNNPVSESEKGNFGPWQVSPELRSGMSRAEKNILRQEIPK